jgi:hypothetical protein
MIRNRRPIGKSITRWWTIITWDSYTGRGERSLCQQDAKELMTSRSKPIAANFSHCAPTGRFCTFLLLALLCSGCGTVSSSSNVQNTPVTVSVTSPASGTTVSGTISVVATASTNATAVQFLIDSASAGAAVTLAPFSFSLNTATLSNGTHLLTAIARNAAGQSATSGAVSITVNNLSPPIPLKISITAPAAGATVMGSITVVATVSADTTSVQFMVDGNNAGALVTAPPFSYLLNTATLSNGAHALAGVASNATGQTATSAALTVTVNNPHLQISSSSLPGGQVGAAYSATLKATGGTPPYTWSAPSGQLPAGLSLSAAGMIAGTPTLAGSSTIAIEVSDSAGISVSSMVSITIATSPPPPPTAPFGHVIVIVEENTNYSDAIGNSSAPYLNGLANQYGLATQYYANTHPSIGNYLALTTGQTLTNDDSQTPLTFPVSVDNVVRELVTAGKSWKAYAESIPSAGYIGGDATGPDGGQFYTRHVPLPFMADVQNSATQRQNIVPFTQFAADLAANTLPNYSFITPNGCDDAHDCVLSVADNWLETNIDPLIKNATFQTDGLLIILFDESGSDNTNGGGRVAAVLISPFSKHGFKSTTQYQHQSVVRLMLEGLGVTGVPAPASAAPKMWEFFTFSPPT